jgi:phosphoadenosine phosphosulfate reductase
MSAIVLYARATAGYEERVAHAISVLQAAALDHGDRIVQATSLGAEDVVITDMIARHQLNIAIATLDTGRLHDETLQLIPRIEQRYAVKVKRFAPPDACVLHFVRSHGESAMYQSIELRKACCALRKLEPLARMLEGASAWVTGLRREQSNARDGVAFRAADAQGRSKINPLADWSWADVWHYIATHEVPYNPLHDRFMPSIGCAPCTRPIAVGEEFRSGRWWWEADAAKECGLHVAQERSAVEGVAA